VEEKKVGEKKILSFSSSFPPSSFPSFFAQIALVARWIFLRRAELQQFFVSRPESLTNNSKTGWAETT
jgi:hypothetical protein